MKVAHTWRAKETLMEWASTSFTLFSLCIGLHGLHMQNPTTILEQNPTVKT